LLAHYAFIPEKHWKNVLMHHFIKVPTSNNATQIALYFPKQTSTQAKQQQKKNCFLSFCSSLYVVMQ